MTPSILAAVYQPEVETVFSSDTWIPTHETTRCLEREDRRKGLKSSVIKFDLRKIRFRIRSGLLWLRTAFNDEPLTRSLP
jgi:hypothetical protein